MKIRHRLLATATLAAILAGCGGGGGDDPPEAPPAPPAPPVQSIDVSGTISAPAQSAVDTDVNDPLAAFAVNDTGNTAQAIMNPATIGGYVNRPGAGDEGRSLTAGDLADFYRVSLAAGQAINLFVADATIGDPDLFLWDQTGTTVIDFSVNVGEFEALTVRTAGTYLIEVHAYGGASNYVLSVGQRQPVNPRGLVGSMDFVPGEAIVRFEDAVAAPAAMQSKVQSLGAESMAGDSGRELLLGLGQGMRLHAAGVTKPANASGEEHMRAMESPELLDKWLTLLSIKELAVRSDVEFAEPNYLLHATAIPNDQLYPQQWHYPLINLPSAWDMTPAGTPIVAVIDTGVLLGHPDLAGKFVAGYDFISDATRARDGNGIDTDPNDPGDASFGGSSFHGTHVAGTIAAATNNRTGVAGVSQTARIMPLRVLGLGGGSSYDIAQAVRFAAGLPNDSGRVPQQRADVINLSLGGGSPTQTEQNVYSQARAAGVIIVAAAGNEGTSVAQYPAAYTGVVGVSAVTVRRTLASYSSFGAHVDVAAPGGDSGDFNGDGYPDQVYSTGGDDSLGSVRYTYRYMNGTSMATPHVAGVAALMKAFNPGLTPDRFDSLLVSGQLTNDIGAAGRDTSFGYGVIDAAKAVRAAAAGTTPPPMPATLSIDPTSLNFGAATSSMEIVAENSGAGTLTMNAPTDDAAWLTVVARTTDASRLGSYVVNVDRRNLAAGTYSAMISFTSTANSVQVPVIMQVTAQPLAGQAGYHYVLLVDPDSGDSRYQVSLNADRGVYAYRFTGVAPGIYQVFAGTDLDNDGSICDSGEACGAYQSLDQPATVDIKASTANVNFDSSFEVAIPAAAGAEQVERIAPRRIR